MLRIILRYRSKNVHATVQKQANIRGALSDGNALVGTEAGTGADAANLKNTDALSERHDTPWVNSLHALWQRS
jgi:hypothetical protein